MVINGTGRQDVAVRLGNSGPEIFISVSKSRTPGQTFRISKTQIHTPLAGTKHTVGKLEPRNHAKSLCRHESASV